MNFSVIKTKFISVIQLTRFREFTGAAILLCTLGAAFSGNFSKRVLFAVILSNLLILAFGFMINDIEDAEDDAKDQSKKLRNPISAGRLSKSEGYLVGFIFVISSLVIAYSISLVFFWVMLSSFIVGFLYSWKKVRLKSIPFLDFISHGYFLSGSIFLSSYVVFNPINTELIAPLAAATMFSFGSALFNQTRDFEVDRETNINNTAGILGKRISVILQNLFMYSALIIGFILIFVYIDIFNFVIMLITVLLTIAAILYIVFVKKKTVIHYHNYLYMIFIPGLILSLIF